MRYILLSSFSLLLSLSGWAQCACQLNLNLIGDCCADLEIFFSPNCSPLPFANEAVINTSAFAPAVGSIRSFTPNYGLTSTINATNDLLTVNSGTSNIATLEPAGTIVKLGTVCFSDVPLGVVTSQLSLGPVGGAPLCTEVIELPLPCRQPENWNKYYGDTLVNTVHKVKAFADGVFVVGEKTENGQRFATVSKFDITSGTLLWDKQLDIFSTFLDLEFDRTEDEVIAVGSTVAPFGTSGAFDNQSLICSFRSSDGTLTEQQQFQHPGREGFLVIKRHPFPEDMLYPYYVLGAQNPVGSAPSGTDISILYNFDKNLGFAIRKEYREVSSVEIEAHRGIVPLNNGNLLLLGNGSIANEGVVIEVDGQNGDYLNSWYFPDGIDWYDGLQLPNDIIVLTGTRFRTDEAIVLAVTPAMQALDGRIFNNLSTFREIGYEVLTSRNNTFYLPAREKVNPSGPVRNVVVRLSLDINPVALGFGLDYTRLLEDGETEFTNPHLSVTPLRDAIFYADNRRFATPVFGESDMLVGVYDLNLSSECAEDIISPMRPYSVNSSPFAMRDLDLAVTPVDPMLTTPDIPYECADFCGSCTADFTWEANCCEVGFTATATGTAPFTYTWDVGCDGQPNPPGYDFTGAIGTWIFPGSGTYAVCLTVTDASGCTASVRKTITVVDNPATLTCPPDVTINTDPGVCFATFTPTDPIYDDDCSVRTRFSCTMSGATTGPLTSPVQLNKGVTTITCLTEDDKGNLVDCSYTVTVLDNEPPTITCPNPLSVRVPACAGGSVVNFPPPVFADNCPMVSYTCSHQSGDFFPCGTTTVTCVATDMAGNQTSCTFPVTVDCQCAEVGGGFLECTAVEDQYSFGGIVINDLTGSGTNGCTVSVSSTQPGVTIVSSNISGSGPGYTLSGIVDITGPVIPTTLVLIVNVSCTCPDGTVHDCSFPVRLSVPCCKDIFVDPQEVCSTAGTVQIPLGGCNTLFDVQQVRWYVADAPCPPAAGWGLPFQVTNGCAPLTLSPQYHDRDICVYAEVDMGPNAGPCRMLTTDAVTITFCDPVGCDLNSSQDYCYTGSAITPMPLTVNIPTSCDLFSIEWFDPNGNPISLPPLTMSYQPPALSFTGGPNDCFQDYTYGVRVTFASGCPPTVCQATIRLYNDAAPVGTLSLLPPDTNPLCYGEDAVLEYDPACAGSPARWTWHESTDGVTYSPLPGNGDRNPVFYTNRLYQDHWYRVKKTNGTCPEDEIDIFLDILDPLVVNNFQARYDNACTPTQVDMQVDFMPSPSPCNFTVSWYENGSLLATTTHTNSPATYSYSGPLNGGNYYCIVTSSCCPQSVKSPVITLDPPMEVGVAGPCFCCNCDILTLTGIVVNPPPVALGYTCTYQWYENGTAIPGANGITYSPQDTCMDNTYTFEVSCTDGSSTCTLAADYTELKCGICMLVGVDELDLLPVRVFPNPTTGKVYLELEEARQFERFEIFDSQGRIMGNLPAPGRLLRHELDLSPLPAGLYYLRAWTSDGELLITKVTRIE